MHRTQVALVSRRSPVLTQFICHMSMKLTMHWKTKQPIRCNNWGANPISDTTLSPNQPWLWNEFSHCTRFESLCMLLYRAICCHFGWYNMYQINGILFPQIWMVGSLKCFTLNTSKVKNCSSSLPSCFLELFQNNSNFQDHPVTLHNFKKSRNFLQHNGLRTIDTAFTTFFFQFFFLIYFCWACRFSNRTDTRRW